MRAAGVDGALGGVRGCGGAGEVVFRVERVDIAGVGVLVGAGGGLSLGEEGACCQGAVDFDCREAGSTHSEYVSFILRSPVLLGYRA